MRLRLISNGMKIILTGGGGSGGHFYPLIAVARALKKEAESERIAKLDLFFVSDDAYDADVLLKENIKFIKIPAGKMRRYFSLKYLPDTIKTIIGLFLAFWRLYILFPDVIFSKGGYASFPILFSAKILGIPVVIHDSDAVPGFVNKWAGKWAKRVAIAFAEAAQYFPGENIAVTGNPVRPQVIGGNLEEAIEYFKLEEDPQPAPVILILGGSQGAEKINEIVLSFLVDAIKTYQIIHQTGESNFKDVNGRADLLLEKNQFKYRYHPYSFLNEGELRNASKAAQLVVSRAGAGSIFEIAAWGGPALLIPFASAAQNHQRENAYSYARAGACEVVEETNLKPHILLAQIDKILGDESRKKQMRLASQNFARLDAADKIAKEVIKLGIHE